MHQIPFAEAIEFEPIVKALKEIGYNGYFTLEAEDYLKSFTADNVFDGIKKLYDSVKQLALIFENS